MGAVTFSSKAFIAPEKSLPIDIISTDQLAQITAGQKTGKKEEPKPKVEKIAEAKPEEDAVGKVTEKKELIKTNSTDAAAAAEACREAGREEARSAEAGRRDQAEGRAEAAGEEA